MSSFSLELARLSIAATYSSVNVCKFFWDRDNSSLEIDFSFSSDLSLSRQSRRIFRTAIFPFSALLFSKRTKSFRRSSFNVGIGIVMVLLSTAGFNPKSEVKIDFSIDWMVLLSHGWMTTVLGPNAELPAIWVKGVGVP